MFCYINTSFGLVSCRLTASQSLDYGSACTARRRGVSFAPARRRGLRSMSGRYSYGIDNPPTLRRSSFPQRVIRPVGVPDSKTGQRGTGLSPLQTPLTLGCAGYKCCFSAAAEKQHSYGAQMRSKGSCWRSLGTTSASIGQTLRCAAGSPQPLRCALLSPKSLTTFWGPPIYSPTPSPDLGGGDRGGGSPFRAPARQAIKMRRRHLISTV